MKTARLTVLAASLASLLGAAACATATLARPSGLPVDAPGAVDVLTSATHHCRPLRTATAEIRLSGHAGAQRVRARILAGFAEPASLRLEALAPFGPPALVFASDGTNTTLLFPRDEQVLRDAPVASVLDALTGLALDAADLRQLLFGCLVPAAGRGVTYGSQWSVVEAAEHRAFVRSGLLVAVDYRGWQVDYSAHEHGVPRAVRVRRATPGGALDLVATVSNIAINIELDARAFTVAVPAGATAMTLGDLRTASPLAREPGS